MYALKAVVPKCHTLIEHKVCKPVGIWANSNVNSRREAFPGSLPQALQRISAGWKKLFGELWSWDPYKTFTFRAHTPLWDGCLLSKQSGRRIYKKDSNMLSVSRNNVASCCVI